MNNNYQPNGTKEDIKIGILHSTGKGHYVTNEGTKSKPSFHVWKHSTTIAICDSAYRDITLAVARCNFLEKYHGIKHIS